MALVISVALLKGGVAKTTTAVALAEAATVAGPVTLVDTDPMGAAVRWSVLADQAGKPLGATVTVVGYPKADVARRLGALSQGAAVVVIDAPPPGALAIATAVIEAASIVVIQQLDQGAPVLDLRRTTRDRSGRAVLHTHIVVAADRVSLAYQQML